jgi:serine/threonine protein kinase
MEYCDGGDLSSFIKSRRKLSERACQKFLQQLAVGLQFLRSHKISHLDLKPQNLLIVTKPKITLKIGGEYTVSLIVLISIKLEFFFPQKKKLRPELFLFPANSREEKGRFTSQESETFPKTFVNLLRCLFFLQISDLLNF